MSRRTCFLLTVSILAAGSLSCHGPETEGFKPKIVLESDKSSPTQGSLDDSRADRMLYQKELIPLAGLVDSFL
jgi:hypothetical protein